MADSILLSCPECRKQLRAAATVHGKKIRCKSCGHVFTAKKPEAKAAPAKQGGMQDLVADNNPYAVTDTDLAIRCPHCAGEMEEGDILCIHCGYNTQTRERHETRKVHERTGGDYVFWLLPGIVCVIVDLIMVGFILFLLIGPLRQIAKDNEEAWWNFGIGATRLWGTICSLGVMFFATMFAFRRLILNPTPPEHERK
jgi:hypothetical protein